MRIHCFQHVSFEGAASVFNWISLHNYSISYTQFFKDDPVFPAMDSFDCLLVLGGPLSVNDEKDFPWLVAEKQFIQEAIHAGKKIIGLCLGAQLIAQVCGAPVYANREKEIGFLDISFTDEAQQHFLFDHFAKDSIVFQWHGETFDLPENAMQIAFSDACNNQGFLINEQVLALQFHLEADEWLVESMLLNEGTELSEERHFIQTEEQIKEGIVYLQQSKKDLFMLLDKFLGNK